LLTFARRQRLNRLTIDLNEHLNSIRDLLASSVGGAVDLLVDIDPHVWNVETDTGELELALVNIAVNARDAMPNGGVIKLRARNVTADGSDAAGLQGDFVALSVSDTGMGIPPDVLAKVFEPFFTTKEVGKGTGLGLSQVYGFARQSGGDVQITSEEGKGTTVTLYLPRAYGMVTEVPPEIPIEESVCAGSTILVVEDNVAVGEVSAMLLEQLGYTVRQVERPAAALALLARDNDVDLVFSDIVMPGDMDGLTLARTIRDRHPSLPVMLATGYSSAAERVGSEFPIIRKPYDCGALGLAVKMALASSAKARAIA
jgi:CheY-like chemotaxis protein